MDVQAQGDERSDRVNKGDAYHKWIFICHATNSIRAAALHQSSEPPQPQLYSTQQYYSPLSLYHTTMILRGPHNLPVSLLSLFFLLSSPSFVQAEDSDPFNCHVTSNGLNYDLTKLAGEHTISRTRDTPPSTMVDSLRFDLCADLKAQDGVAEADQVRFQLCITTVNSYWQYMSSRSVLVGLERVWQKWTKKGTTKTASSPSYQ